MKIPSKPASLSRSESNQKWVLKLYVAGNTPNSISALKNLRAICEEHLKGRFELEIVDILVRPEAAESDQIVAVPALVRKMPEPFKRLIGDLSNPHRLLVSLDIVPLLTKRTGVS